MARRARPHRRVVPTRVRRSRCGPGDRAPHQLRGVDRITLGRDCAIYEGAWLAVEEGGGPLTIGDHTYLGHGVHLHAIDPVRIGSRCVLADGVYVTSTDHDRDDRHRTHGTGAVTIGDDVFLGQRAVVLGGVTIGDGATVAAHAVVTRDVAARDRRRRDPGPTHRRRTG